MGVAMYKGRVAGVNSREYSFADRTTGEKIEGVTHRLYLVTEDEPEPVKELRCSDDLATTARQHIGKVVEVGAEPRARNNQVIWHCTHIKGIG
jgi:hypothetical protein